jgi:hypothetical protein
VQQTLIVEGPEVEEDEEEGKGGHGVIQDKEGVNVKLLRIMKVRAITIDSRQVHITQNEREVEKNKEGEVGLIRRGHEQGVEVHYLRIMKVYAVSIFSRRENTVLDLWIMKV